MGGNRGKFWVLVGLALAAGIASVLLPCVGSIEDPPVASHDARMDPAASPRAVEDRIVESLASGGRTVIERYETADSESPASVVAVDTRPLTEAEIEELSLRLHRHLASATKMVGAKAQSSETEDAFQVAAGRATIVETIAALDCIHRGQAYVRLSGRDPRSGSAWRFLEHHVSTLPRGRMVTIAIDLGRFPEIAAMNAEMDAVRRYKNDEYCFEWNSLDRSTRARIVDEGRVAQQEMNDLMKRIMELGEGLEVQSEVQGLRRQMARLGAVAGRMPVGELGPDLEAIPGVTVFNRRPGK